MTTFYPQRNRRAQRTLLMPTFIGAVVILVVLVLLQVYVGGVVGKAALVVGRPFAETYEHFKDGTNFFGHFFKSRSTLIQENRDLRAFIEANTSDTIRLRALEEEYEALLDSFGRATTTSRAVLANVITKPPQSPYDVLIVDAGTDNSVRLGGQVMSAGDVVIGRVQNVTKSAAKIVLFSSVGEKSNLSLGRTSEPVEVMGTGGGNLEAEVSQDMDIVVGDSLMLPQFGGGLVANVASIDSSVTSASKRVLFKMPVNVFALRWVTIGAPMLQVVELGE